MSLEKVLKKHLPSELFTQVVDALGDDFDMDFVPRSRLNTVIKQRNDLRQQLEVAGTDGDEGDDTAPTNPPKNPSNKNEDSEAAKLQAKLDAIEAKHQAELNSVKIQHALTDALRSEGCNNPKLLMSQLDMEKITFNDKGELEGHADQVTAWKESDPYLFSTIEGTSEGDSNDGTGVEGLTGSSSKVKKSSIDAELESIFETKLD